MGSVRRSGHYRGEEAVKGNDVRRVLRWRRKGGSNALWRRVRANGCCRDRWAPRQHVYISNRDSLIEYKRVAVQGWTVFPSAFTEACESRRRHFQCHLSGLEYSNTKFQHQNTSVHTMARTSDGICSHVLLPSLSIQCGLLVIWKD